MIKVNMEREDILSLDTREVSMVYRDILVTKFVIFFSYKL